MTAAAPHDARHQRGRLAAARLALGLAAVSAALPGVWAAASPRGFYDGFPGVLHWVDRLPPYNEHLTVDVGAFYLAFAVLLGWAAVRPSRSLVVPVCAAWILFSTLHLLFHVTHLKRFPTVDAVLQSVTLSVTLAWAVIALWALPKRGHHGLEDGLASQLPAKRPHNSQ